jgi:group I intron endonuclease
MENSMTIGIYYLQFEGTDKVYIGQSVNVELRLSRHLYLLKNNMASKRLQQAFALYGPPTGYLLESCTAEELTSLENIYIEEFNSIYNGLNTISNHKDVYYTTALRGEESPRSLYSNEQICQVFEMLTDTTYHPPKVIQKVTKVSLEVINGVSLGRRHSWLKEMYPNTYDNLFKRTFLEKQVGSQGAKARGIVYPAITSPEGLQYTVDCVAQFSREHGLTASALGRVLRGVRNSHKGWHL